MKDVEALIHHIKDVDKKAIPSIDLDNLAFIGHSYGGMTAIEACYEYPEEFKRCVAIDPGMYPCLNSSFHAEMGTNRKKF
jgi:pimeloyl-ACP methyl ester carboxylesterase